MALTTGTRRMDDKAEEIRQAPKIEIFGRRLPLPKSRWPRIAVGVALCLGGVVGFLPILGFWMLPLGLLVLSYEFAWVRRHRRRVSVWWGRRRSPKKPV